MAKKRTMNDDVFGELTHCVGNLWRRPISLHIFGRDWTIALGVDVDPKTGVEENQIIAFRAFSEKTKAVVAAGEKAILEYYRSICDDYRGRHGIVAPHDARMPIIKSKREIYKLVKPEGITFPYVRPRPTFGILCQCTWEEEHGLAAKFENDKLVGVGFQDIVL